MTLEEIQQALYRELPVSHEIRSHLGESIPIFGFKTGVDGLTDPACDALCLAPFEAVERKQSDRLAQYANLNLHRGEAVQMDLFRVDDAPVEHEIVRMAYRITELPNVINETTPAVRAGASDHADQPPSIFTSRWNASVDDIWRAALFVRKTIRERLTAFFSEHADLHLLRLCQRIPVSHRLAVYRFAVGHQRRIQLVETHPLLACVIANELRMIAHVWEQDSRGTAALTAESNDDVAMIDAGEALKELCNRKRMPYWMRRLPMHPRMDINHVAQLVDLRFGPEILNAMPKAPHQVGEWVSHLVQTAQAITPAAPITGAAQRRVDEARHWMVNNCMKLSKSDLDRHNRVVEALDFIAAPQNQFTVDRLFQARDGSNAAHVPLDQNGMIAPLNPENVINPAFSPSMSPARLAELIEAWHLELAQKQADDTPPFPQPPFPAQELDGYTLTPIEDAFALFMEGKTMHHCVATYTGRILTGDSYIYSFKKGAQPIATVEMALDFPLTLKQASGHCNRAVAAEDIGVLQTILHTISADLESDRATTSDASNRLS